jgi:hypothetical protein
MGRVRSSMRSRRGLGGFFARQSSVDPCRTYSPDPVVCPVRGSGDLGSQGFSQHGVRAGLGDRVSGWRIRPAGTCSDHRGDAPGRRPWHGGAARSVSVDSTHPIARSESQCTYEKAMRPVTICCGAATMDGWHRYRSPTTARRLAGPSSASCPGCTVRTDHRSGSSWSMMNAR